MTQRLTGPALVEYLRDNPTSDAMMAAADEIERLRAALTELCDEIDKHEIHAAISKTSISWFKRKARTALAQEEA